jgi:NAD(P)-dependent dehydrogenase (short-subunit alcohol dehydrogenase family)
MPSLPLTGKVALVTGAAQGIGRNYALGLAAAGATVCVSDVTDTSETEALLYRSGAKGFGCSADITDAKSLTELATRIEDKFGRLDILVNNAAIFSALKMKPFYEISNDEWDRVLTVNVRGCWQTICAVRPLMKKAGAGKIINIASATVFKGTPMLLHYVTSKAAIIGLTRSVARELANDNILVNAIAPGLVMSPQVAEHPDWTAVSDRITATRAIKRESVPDDMVGTLLFLAGPASDFMTGQTIVVDGGSVMH